MYLTLPLLDHTVPTWLSYCISPSPYLFSAFLSVHPVSNHPLCSKHLLFHIVPASLFCFIRCKKWYWTTPFFSWNVSVTFCKAKNVPLSFLHGQKEIMWKICYSAMAQPFVLKLSTFR
jgi:hypothetical protein